ncbi:MAG: hypothetical protein JWN86_687 [Planctomycetota bacterium]|nr:hypothetical protein [Planctomycetota bacterium]
MTRPTPRGHRAGITLTEILISILIMGIGMLSLATLFPLGLQRLRDAARSSRSALLTETAASEIASRDLLYKQSFLASGYAHDPFTEDPATAAEATAIVTGIDRITSDPAYTSSLRGGTGLPVCYDPLWWYQVYAASGGVTQPTLTAGSEFRFASGIGLIRNDGKSGVPSAHGLQRLTNFPLGSNAGAAPFYIDPSSVFASQDDIVMQTDGSSSTPGSGSPIVPDGSAGGIMRDLSYTWMFTGQQTDTSNGTIFDGDLVIFHNRPFATEIRGGQNAAAGETVVEAIWGYGPPSASVAFAPYSINDRSVLLRWPNTQPDPDVRVGGYIADVTYERFNATELSRWYGTLWSANYPAQRCYWYRVAKKTDPTSDHDANLAKLGYREMIVTLSSPVRAKTPLDVTQTTTVTPLHINAAFVSPHVVNVVSRVFYTR